MARQPTSAGDSAAYERRSASLDDVVIVSAVRTALCKAKRGGFKDTPVDDLIATVLRETIARTGVEPEVRGVAGIARTRPPVPSPLHATPRSARLHLPQRHME